MSQPLVQVEQEIDEVIERAIMAGDPLIATDYGNNLSRTIVLRGIALAKLLYGMRSNWHYFRLAGIEEDFLDFVEAHMVGVAARTADKYASMYESVFANNHISPTLKDQLAEKPIKTLILLTAAVREGSLGEDQLEDVILKDHPGVRQMVREARGRERVSRNYTIGRISKRNEGKYPRGAIVVFGQEEEEVVGWIKLDDLQTEAGKRYVEKIQNVLGLEELR